MKRLKLYSVIVVMVAAIVCIQGVAAGSTQIYASALSDAQSQKKKVENQLKDIESQLAAEQKKLNSAKSEAEKLLAQANIEQKEKEKLAAELLLLYKDIEELDALIADAEKTYNDKETEFLEKARLIYLYSKKSSFEILAESESFLDFFRRVQFLILLEKTNKEMLIELVEQKQEIEVKKSLKTEDSDTVAQKISDTDLELKKINMSKEELEKEINATKGKMTNLLSLEDDLEKESKALVNKINKLVEEENAKNPTKPTYTGGAMKWPLPSSTRITSQFGNRKDPITGKNAYHSGIDIGAPKGNSIIAAADGKVILAGWNGGYGNCVIIDHGNGITTLYGHASSLLVSKGQTVKAGTVIAKVGSTGRSTGNHLHFEVRKNGSPVDPMKYVTK